MATNQATIQHFNHSSIPEFPQAVPVELSRDERISIGLRGGLTYSEQMTAFRSELLNRTLEFYHGNQCRCARALGMHRNTFSRLVAQMREKGSLRAEWHEYRKHVPRKPMVRVQH